MLLTVKAEEKIYTVMVVTRDLLSVLVKTIAPSKTGSLFLNYQGLLKYLSVLILASVISGPAYSAGTFVMAFGQNPEESPQYLFYQKIYSELFQELGFEFSYLLCPSKRCSQMANSGVVDGEPQRIKTYADLYPNMVRVDEPVFINRTLMFTLNPEVRKQGALSLRDSGYRIEYLRGSVWSKQYLTPLVAPYLLSEVATPRQALQRLILGRTDIFVALEAPVMQLFQKAEFSKAGILSAGVVGENESFPYLHISHQEQAKAVETVLRRMKEDGRYSRILDRAMPFLKADYALHSSTAE